MRTKGEQKGGGTEKTEKTERESLPFQPLHSAGVYLFRHQPAGFQKGSVKGEAPCPLPTRVIKPGKQTVVHPVWDCNPQVGLSPTWTPVYRNLLLQPITSRTPLGSRK